MTTKTTKTTKAAAKPKRKRGRPSLYTKALAAEICARMSSGKSIRKVCLDDDMPALVTVFKWLGDGKHQDFVEQYARARDALADFYADLARDTAEAAQGCESGPSVMASRLLFDACKWSAAHVAPRKYSEKLLTENKNENTNTTTATVTGSVSVDVKQMSMDELMEIARMDSESPDGR